MIVYIINHLIGHKMGDVRNKVLYCAPTNAAVDEMTRRLLKFHQGSSEIKGKIIKIAYFVFVFFVFIEKKNNCDATFSSTNGKLGQASP